MSGNRQRTPRPRSAEQSGSVDALQAAAEQLELVRAAAPAPAHVLLAGTRYMPPECTLARVTTARLLPARYSDSVLTRIADTDEDLQAIYALDNATNERLLAEANTRPGIAARELVFGMPYARIINAAFTHPHPLGARFSMPYRGAWYAGFELATAKAEVLFHRSVQLTEIGWAEPEELDYDHYSANFTGSFHDLRVVPEVASEFVPEVAGEAPTADGERLRAERAACLDPGSYVASQELAMQLLESGSLGVVYPSARRAGGTCLACFRPAAVAGMRKRDMHRLTWYPDRPPTFVRVARTHAAAPGPEAL